MSLIERGNTVEGAIRQLRSNPLQYGLETFITKQDIGRTGSKTLNATKRRVDRIAQGQPISRIPGVSRYLGPGAADGVVGNMFHTKNVSPLFEDGLGDEDEYNMTYAVNRQVNKPGRDFQSIQPHELAILFKNTEGNLNTCRLEGDSTTTQCNSLSIIPPEVYNYATGQLQQREARMYPEMYRKRTPIEYWKDYSIDGIPEHVSPFESRSSMYSTGTMTVRGGAFCETEACTMMTTMAARAVIKVANYWGSNVKPGAELWAVIKKFEQSDYSYDYMLGSRVLTDHTGKRLAAANDCEVNPMRPYQMAFFSLPDGGPVPPEYTQYYDEEGRFRRDSHLIRIGTVTEVPLGHVYRDVSSRLKPFTGRVANCDISQYAITTNNYVPPTSHRTLTIRLKPDDGIMPL